jgi:drug/metabolite transporter (DMT)-like permease
MLAVGTAVASDTVVISIYGKPSVPMPPVSSPPMPARSRLTAYLLLTASMTLVGGYVALSKPLVAALPVFALAFLRFAIGGVAMIPWTRPARGEAPLTGTEHRWLFLMSFFGNFLFSVFMLSGIQRTTATAAGVILATLPAAVALLSRVFLREPLGRRALLAIALAVTGIVLLQFAKGDAGASARDAVLGNLLMFGAVLCEATYVILGKRLAATRTPLRVSALINLWGLALTAPFGLWQLRAVELGTLGGGLWTLLVFYALAAGLFSVWMWVSGLKHVPANHAGVFTVAMPIAATAVGVLLLGESFTGLHAVALALAAAGVVLIATAPAAASGAARSPLM